MQYYFISEFPAIIKINGVYSGKIDKTMKKFSLEKNAFIEVCPLNRTEYPISFMLDSEFLSNPPNGTIITDLKGAYVISFICLSSFAPFSIINQQKFPFAVVTVFRENGLKLSIETPTDFYTQTFFMTDCHADISPFVINNYQFIAVHFVEKNLLTCYLLEEKITKVFSKTTHAVCFENGLKTTQKFLDIAKHKLTIEWDFFGKNLIAKNTYIERDENYKVEDLSEAVIPYAFLEEFLVGGNVDEFLSDNLKQNSSHLKGFFGDFIGVFPPPEFKCLNAVGLIYSKSQNEYFAEYFSFDTNNKKIYNIKKD